jgi:glutathione S-transferase
MAQLELHQMAQLALFGNRESGHAYKVRLMLALSGLAHDYHEIDLDQPRAARPEPFRSLSRYGEVPLLVHDGKPYVQSNAILLHLADHTGTFGGESDERMERAREWLFWEANRIGFSLANLRYCLKFTGTGAATDGAQFMRQRFEADAVRLEQELADGRAFILGEQASVADISLCGYLFWHDQAKVVLPAGIQAWLARISALPGWKHPYDF